MNLKKKTKQDASAKCKTIGANFNSITARTPSSGTWINVPSLRCVFCESCDVWGVFFFSSSLSSLSHYYKDSIITCVRDHKLKLSYRSEPDAVGPAANLLWSPSLPVSVQSTGASQGSGGRATPHSLALLPCRLLQLYVPFHITQALVNVAGRC